MSAGFQRLIRLCDDGVETLGSSVHNQAIDKLPSNTLLKEEAIDFLLEVMPRLLCPMRMECGNNPLKDVVHIEPRAIVH